MAGFSKVEIVDASRECLFGIRKHVLRSLFGKWLAGAINISAFRARVKNLIGKQKRTGYYLLVCAQKGESQ